MGSKLAVLVGLKMLTCVAESGSDRLKNVSVCEPPGYRRYWTFSWDNTWVYILPSSTVWPLFSNEVPKRALVIMSESTLPGSSMVTKTFDIVHTPDHSVSSGFLGVSGRPLLRLRGAMKLLHGRAVAKSGLPSSLLKCDTIARVAGRHHLFRGAVHCSRCITAAALAQRRTEFCDWPAEPHCTTAILFRLAIQCLNSVLVDWEAFLVQLCRMKAVPSRGASFHRWLIISARYTRWTVRPFCPYRVAQQNRS